MWAFLHEKQSKKVEKDIIPKKEYFPRIFSRYQFFFWGSILKEVRSDIIPRDIIPITTMGIMIGFLPFIPGYKMFKI